MECWECGQEVGELYDDHRSPPLDIDQCLCIDCAESAAEEAIEEHQNAIDRIQESITCDRTSHNLKEKDLCLNKHQE